MEEHAQPTMTSSVVPVRRDGSEKTANVREKENKVYSPDRNSRGGPKFQFFA